MDRDYSEGPEYQAEIHLGHKLYKPTLMAWLNKTKSDVEFQGYFSASPKESKGWSIETMLQIGGVNFDEDKKVYSSQPKPKLWRNEYFYFCEDGGYKEQENLYDELRHN